MEDKSVRQYRKVLHVQPIQDWLLRGHNMKLKKLFYFALDDVPSYVHEIAIAERPNIPAPEKDYYTPGDITGVNGKYYEDLGTFRNVEIKLECSFISRDPNKWAEKWREIKNWILREKHKVIRFSDDEGFYRKIAKISLSSSERKALHAGVFTITLEAEPFEYLNEGLTRINHKCIKENRYYECCPTFILNSTDMQTLTVNGREFKVDCKGKTIVNTELKIAYSDNSLVNTVGDFEDLWFESGKCEVKSTCPCLVQPNWRCV